MKHLLLLLAGIFVFTSFGLDTSCFREVSTPISAQTGQTIRIHSNTTDIIPLQGEKILMLKPQNTTTPQEYFDYTVSSSSGLENKDFRVLIDNDAATSLQFTQNPKSITLTFPAMLQANTFEVFLDADSFDLGEIAISSDGKTFTPILFSNINRFSFSSLRFEFIDQIKNSKTTLFSPTRIRDILFLRNPKHTFLIKSLSSESIRFYTDSDCSPIEVNQEIQKISNITTQYTTDSNTPNNTLNFITNPTYNNDRDTDGINNVQDNCPFTSNQNQKDTDLDRIGDVCDLDPKNRNPYLGDTDSDGIDDAQDNCLSVKNSDQRDSNTDGRGDVCSDDDDDGIMGRYDNCPTVSNRDQKDINVNGVGDVCESDRDNDGFFDSVDVCSQVYNPDQKDSDADNIGDVCDNCTRYNPDQRDEDNDGTGDVCTEWEAYQKTHDDDKDGIINWGDNCPKISNPAVPVFNTTKNIQEMIQLDFDGDGIGDACDNCLDIQNADQKDDNKNGIGDLCEDLDGDGIQSYQDNCPLDANPDQADKNRDGLGDLCDDTDNDRVRASQDNCPYIYNPDQMNSDNDEQGDVCDKKDDRFLESNKNIFITIFTLIGLCLMIGIFFLSKKLLAKDNEL